MMNQISDQRGSEPDNPKNGDAPEDDIENHIQPKEQLRESRDTLEVHRQRHDACRHDKGEITWEKILNKGRLILRRR